MASPTQDLAEWARQIYGPSSPGAMLDINTTITPTMLPHPSFDLMVRIQVQEAISATHRSQSTQGSYTTDTSALHADIAARSPQDNATGRTSSSPPYSTGRDSCSTEPTDPCLSDSDSEAAWAPATAASIKRDGWVRTARMVAVLERLEEQVNRKIRKAQEHVPFGCFPVKYQNLVEEQKRHEFFWRFGPDAYKKEYVQGYYVGDPSGIEYWARMLL